ncbi:MAG: Aspartyl-tRNA(Asn) amidotransferase subunit A @ Glutamyl-tRNA(Gln) amidotransferase subunit A [uncultured Thermomicrobiales bacterium]|uniref:Aspartyl-tRNA(Asn) amidotransferase subunit A @ Glutamyl-tRNA(Gln) amidotransferase subunit A n=1 Tax=uncultured Thermomicrobiales bacterium TaxID=1645740 RepID=A0A6J4U4J2_9BACT|nr:MAG: Aspartyl-tRNA(Asn) amidotransferase subunit A @ Glutamyl-tRNA(Gln) amidotransferase subunit A [uncultured Thermomicrobiales bacterium]
MGGIGRRTIVKAGLGLGAAAQPLRTARAEQPDAQAGARPVRPLDLAPFEETLAALSVPRRWGLDLLLRERGVAEIGERLASGQVTAVELVAWHVGRIVAHDAALRSVLELNPDAPAIAAGLDAELARGERRGALHGIPVLLKDTIGTGDRMHTTAGAAALRYARCDRDAALVTALRAAGAVVLGKANLSEWSYWMSSVAPSGYSALGGQTVSPYGAGIDPWGSSTGSAVAVSAGFATLAVGAETAGSIVSPAARASVVGMRPSHGLVGRDRVIPICGEVDTAGPLGRSVADIAALLTTLAASGDGAPADRTSATRGTDFSAALQPRALRRVRIGVVAAAETVDAPDEAAIAYLGLEETVAAMRRAGAKVTVARAAPFAFEGPGFVPQFDRAMRTGVDAYLRATEAPVTSLAEVIAFNDEDPAAYAPWGQDRLWAGQTSPLGAGAARALAKSNREQAEAYLGGLLAEQELDALVTVDSMLSLIYPFADFPAIAVPAGLNPWGTPFAATFVGRRGSDAELLGFAYAFEQASRLRVPPRL